MKRLILIMALVLLPVSGWAATYYVSPTGSNTSPYDTWAKAANLPATAITAGNTDAGGDGPHVMYIAPGAYAGGMTFNDADWVDGRVIGAGMGSTIIAPASAHCIYVAPASTGMTISGLTLRGTSTSHDTLQIEGANSTLRYIDVEKTGRYTLMAVATGLIVENSRLPASPAAFHSVNFVGSSSGTIKNTIFTGELTGAATAYNLVRMTSSGTWAMDNVIITGGHSPNYVQTAGTMTIRNSAIFPGTSTTAYAVDKSGGTLHLINNYIGMNWNSTHRQLNGTIDTDTNNMKTGGAALRRHLKGGMFTFSVDDAVSVDYALEVELLLRERKLSGTWYVDAFSAITNAERKSKIQGVIDRHNADGYGLEIQCHSYSHSDLSLTGNIFSITKAGHTVDIDRTGVRHGGVSGIYVEGPAPVTVTNYRNKSMSAIMTELTTGGCSVGALRTNVHVEALGEIMSDSAGPQASGYTAQLMVTDVGSTGVPPSAGYYYAEIYYPKLLLESNFNGINLKNFASPFGVNSANIKSAIINSGYESSRYNMSTGGASWQLSSIDTYAIAYTGNQFYIGANPTETDTYMNAVAFAIESSGLYFHALSHNATEMSVSDVGKLMDTMMRYPGIMITKASTAVQQIKTSGTWSTSDNITYTRTWTDASDYRPRSGSPLIGAGTPIAGLTTDYIGKLWKNPPSIGAYEYYRTGGGSRGFSGFNLGFGL